MVYTILISIVFIAELIIAVTVVQNLLRLDKAVLELDGTITAAKPGVRDISKLGRKISEQLIFFSKDFVEKVKRNSEDILLKQISRALIGILILNLNFKFVKKFRKSKTGKTLAKGLSFLESMV